MTDLDDQQASAPTNGSKRTLRRRLLRWIGIDANPGIRTHIWFTRRFYVLMFVLFGLPLISLIGLSMYSTSPSFCNSCHIMEPYYKAWESSVHNQVACVDCHYPPGDAKTMLWHKFQALSQVVKYVTRTYSSKPYAEVDDESCLRSGCHSTRLLQGKVLSESGIIFDHRPHLEGVRYGRQLRCVSCHSQIVVGKHIEVTWDTCYLCHLKGRKEGRNIEPMGGCLACHMLPDEPVQSGNIVVDHQRIVRDQHIKCASCHQDVIQGDGIVEKDRCLTCHNQQEKLDRFDDTPFLHENHVTKHNVACFHCHKEIRHGVTAAGTKPLQTDCSVCHTSAHDLQQNFYRGVGAQGLADMPSPMYLANVDCVACHTEAKPSHLHLSKATTFVGSEDGCITCHGEEYRGTLSEGNDLVTNTLHRLQDKLAVLKVAVDAIPVGEAAIESARHQIAVTTTNLTYVESVRAGHNIYYASAILRKADDDLNQAAAGVEIATGDLSDLPLISGAFCATLCHSKLGIEVPPETTDFHGMEMPHAAHIEDMELKCTTCHEIRSHKELELKGLGACYECHEKDELPTETASGSSEPTAEAKVGGN
ncbi:MAG: NapC/NirT family cytochrome c [Verrucomicrobia bacterium]|nr:NapC/NirT family cytochrome c [Verrucomicrobiota bacterium]MDA1087100.1 NapC/NirT family cytochrome c [Verrucomicrobiota bacterium]